MERLIVSVSGVRGIVGETLTPQIARDFGCAFGTMLGIGSTVVIGRDTRPSGQEMETAVVSGLTATGVNAVSLGVVTTPGAALMTRKLSADGGVVITASHNPSRYNGIKFLQPTGPALRSQDAERLKAIWESGKFNLAGDDRPGCVQPNGDTHACHVSTVCDVIDIAAIAKRRFKVVVDSINGAGCAVTPILLNKLGCRLVHINAEPTGEFAHTPEPIQENLTQLCREVRNHGADVGFAQDPDADRLVIVDEAGRFIGEEYTLALAGAFVLSRRKGKLATNLATSRMIDDVASAAGVEVVRAPTGEANVVEAMQREGCIFAGEGNGGVIEPAVVPVRDSLVGMAYILQYMAETNQPVSALAARIPSYVMVKTRMACPAGATDEICRRTRKAFESRPDARFNDADGLRIDLPEGWVGVRGSNTEPILRIFAEAPDEGTAEGLVARVREIAESTIGG